jgi:ABC-2 type transport system permease protein
VREEESAGALRASLARELARYRARPWDAVVLTLLPLAFMALVAWIFSAGVPRELPVAVMDADRSALSRQLVRWVDATPGVRVTLAPAGPVEGFAALRERRVVALLVIPEGFARRVLTSQPAVVELHSNAQYSSHAGAISQAVRGAVGTLSAGIEIAAREKRGAAPLVAQAQFEPIRVQLATLFNESLDYELFMGGSLLPALLQIAAMAAAVSVLGRELKDGTVPEWLAVAGGRWPVALAAKLALPTVAMLGLAALYVAGFDAGFGYPIRGSAAAIAAALVALVLASEAMGVLLLAATLSFRMGLSLVAFYAGAAFAFSGQGFPLLAMPPLARAWAAVIPLTHYLQLHNRHWLEGAPFSYAGGELAALAAFVVVGFGVGGVLLARRAMRPTSWGRA